MSLDLPEALRSIQRFEVVDCIDDKHVPAVIPNPHGPWVRYEDHIAALAAWQATAAQQAAEPVALLVRKNSWRDGQWEAAPPNSPSYGLAWANQRMYVYTTPQPTQPQAGAVPVQPPTISTKADSVQEDAAP